MSCAERGVSKDFKEFDFGKNILTNSINGVTLYHNKEETDEKE